MPPKKQVAEEAAEAAPEEDAGPKVVPPLPDEELEERAKVFDEIFAECHPDVAKKGSVDERDAGGLDDEGFTYGEMDMLNMHKILNMVKQDFGPLYENQGAFVDLGSGCGKACVAAGLLHPFSKVVGIEYLSSLSTQATAAEAKFTEVALPEGVTKPETQFTKGDFVADMASLLPLAPETILCLAVATCFNEDRIEALAKFASAMPADSLFVTFTQMLPESVLGDSSDGGWSVLCTFALEMLWGTSTCFIFKKQKPEVVVEGGDDADAAAAAPA